MGKCIGLHGLHNWLAQLKNMASFRQCLFGECPVEETWFCFEHEAHQNLVKEKQLTVIAKKDDLEVPIGKNLFIDLIEKISKELNFTNCWVCGSTKMTEIWPWEGIGLGPLEVLRWVQQSGQKPQNLEQREKEQWDLKSKVIGEKCIMRMAKRYNTPLGKMACKRYLVIKNLGTKWIPWEPD